MVKSTFTRRITRRGGRKVVTTTVFVGGKKIGTTTREFAVKRGGGVSRIDPTGTQQPITSKLPSTTKTTTTISKEKPKTKKELIVEQQKQQQQIQPRTPLGRTGQLIRRGVRISGRVAREQALRLETKQARAKSRKEEVITGAGIFATGAVVRTGEVVESVFKPVETGKGLLLFGRKVVTQPSQTLFEAGETFKKRPTFTAGKAAVDVALLKGTPAVTSKIKIRKPKETVSKVTGVAVQEVEGVKPITFKGIEKTRPFKTFKFGLEAEIKKPKKKTEPVRIKGRTEVFQLDDKISIGKTAFETQKPKLKGISESIITKVPERDVFVSASKISEPVKIVKKGRQKKVIKGLGLSREVLKTPTEGFDVSKVVGLQITKRGRAKTASAFEVDVFKLKQLRDVKLPSKTKKKIKQAPPISQEIFAPIIEKTLTERRTKTIKTETKPTSGALIGRPITTQTPIVTTITEVQPLAMKFKEPTPSFANGLPRGAAVSVSLPKQITRQRTRQRGVSVTRQKPIVIPITKTVTKTVTRAKPIEVLIPKSRSLQRTRTALRTIGTSRGIDTFRTPVTGFPVVVPPVGITLPKTTRKKPKVDDPFGLKFKTAFSPSVEAKIFKIRGKRPTPRQIATGVVLRPLPIR
jgi:hypothetical protein|tara:strand:+ start:1024 stop:2928 length:1905 start_codon:yes stop_codon:yes gene_type:complete